MYCTKCGKPLKKDAKFCSKCGSTVKKKDEIITKEEKRMDSICSNTIVVCLTIAFLAISISLIGIISLITNNLGVI